MAERELTEQERALFAHLTAVNWPGAEDLHESVSHLVVTGGCDCGCASITVRDTRRPTQRHELEHWCNAVSPDGASAVVLWLGSDRRIAALDVEQPEDGSLPDPSGLAVTSPYDTGVDLLQVKLGASASVVEGEWSWPIHGLRHPPQSGTSGWYIWTGEWAEDPDFFTPLHAQHLIDRVPELKQYLYMPPGSRFLHAPDHQDIWRDEALFNV